MTSNLTTNCLKLIIAMEYIFDLLVTINDLQWRLINSNDLKLKKLQKYGFMLIKWKLVVTQAM